MLTVIMGGSGSGKSAYAENLFSSMEGEKYYLATMQIYDEESKERVKRHRKLREGKGFHTLELPKNVSQAKLPPKACVLLECMSNLVANEMFGEKIQPREWVVEKVLKEVLALQEQTQQLVIVTNNLFEDGIVYDADTMAYLEALGEINGKLAERADSVVEVVVGIPVFLKGQSLQATEKYGC